MSALVLPRSWGTVQIEAVEHGGEACVRLSNIGERKGTVTLRVSELVGALGRIFAVPPAVTEAQRKAARDWLAARGAR